MNKVSTKGTVFEKLFGQPDHLEDLPSEETTPETAKLKREGTAISNTFTGYVDVIRRSDKILGERVSDVGKLLWGLVGNRQVPAMIGPTPTKTIAFATDGKMGMIIIPPDWPKAVLEDGIMQLGAVVFAGTQARDYYNDHIDGNSRYRAIACEVEALYGISKFDETWEPNDYQKEVMSKYPLGIDSLPPGVWYESKPYTDPRPGESL